MGSGGGGRGTNSHCWLTAIKIKDGSHFGDGTERKKISQNWQMALLLLMSI